MTTYKAEARRSDGWWALSSPDVFGAFAQVRRLSAASDAIRSAIAEVLEVDESKIDVELHVRFDDKTEDLLARVQECRLWVASAEAEYAKAMRKAVTSFNNEGMSVRDIGTLLGVSFQRVAQIAKG